MANRNFANSRIYTGHVMPVLIDCNFIVDSTNGNGLGIRSLKGPYVQNVFMHTSATPGVGNSNPQTPNIAITNPNPASGTIIVQLQDNYNRILTSGNAIISPLGTPVAITAASTNLTVGVAYVVTTLGDAAAADWVTLGIPSGITPTVGMTFIAKATGAGVGTTARVAPTATAGSAIFQIEGVGDANQMAGVSIQAKGYGAQIIAQCRNASGASGASTIVAPANNTVISMSFLLSNSSILIAGE